MVLAFLLLAAQLQAAPLPKNYSVHLPLPLCKIEDTETVDELGRLALDFFNQKRSFAEINSECERMRRVTSTIQHIWNYMSEGNTKQNPGMNTLIAEAIIRQNICELKEKSEFQKLEEVLNKALLKKAVIYNDGVLQTTVSPLKFSCRRIDSLCTEVSEACND